VLWVNVRFECLMNFLGWCESPTKLQRIQDPNHMLSGGMSHGCSVGGSVLSLL